MCRLFSALAFLYFIGSLSAPPAHAVAPRETIAHITVELKGVPVAADPNLKANGPATGHHFRLDSSLHAFRWYAAALARYQDREIVYLRAQGIQLSVGGRYQIVFNGFSATLPSSDLARLARLANVLSISPIHRYRPLLDRSAQLVHAPEAWSQLGGAQKAGLGLKIANIDSGIDVKNPCFRDTGMNPPGNGFPTADTHANLGFTNNKVIVARAFGPDSHKDYSARDVEGHGTFIGAIEACDYNTSTPLGTRISGVAPAAYLLSYNIFPTGYNQPGDTDPFLSALDVALRDSPDAINLSIGSPFGLGDLRLDPDSAAVNVAINAGFPVIIAAGNNGPTPQSVASPAAAPRAIAVGSSTNSRGLYSSVTVNGPGAVPSNLGHFPGNEMSHAWSGTVGPAQTVDVGLGRRPGNDPGNPQADDYAGKDVRGKIVLIQRGNQNRAYILVSTKIKNAQDAGALGAILYDNTSELLSSGADQGDTALPAMFIGKANGEALVRWMQNHPDATLTMDSAKSSYEQPANVLSAFSSRGYGANYAIKPELVAPGEDIYSATERAVPSDMSSPDGFTSQSGTSFSAPHVTAAAALILQKHPTWTPAKVKSVLMDTASLNVFGNVDRTSAPTVMQVGDGLLNVDAALLSSAYLSVAAQSFGEVNVGSGTVVRNAKMTLNDAGKGAGHWSVGIRQLHGSQAVRLQVPPTVDLPAGRHVDLTLKLIVAGNASSGDYDGYVTLTRDDESIHAAYYVHVAAQRVKAGSVLLVDDSTSLFQPSLPLPALPHKDVRHWYEVALTVIGRPYIYWDESILGTPSLQDLKQASAVIYFTGSNLNELAPQNSNAETLAGPLSPADVSVLHSYLDAGGRVFVSGMGAALSDPYWSYIVMGGLPTGLAFDGAGSDLSLYDNSKNDKSHKGGISPPRPSAVPDTNTRGPSNKWIFGGLKSIDFSSSGDGARDNLAAYSSTVAHVLGEGMVGVPGLVPVRGNFDSQGTAYGQAALRTTNKSLVRAGPDVAVVSSDESSFQHRATYPGRSVMFSFGFEGINDNTGYASRAQVLQRIFQWFDDKPVAGVGVRGYRSRQQVQLVAVLKGRARPVMYTWQIGGKILRPTSKSTPYRFGRPGAYRLRVQITDSLGHVAVSPWTTLRVR